MKPRRDVVYVPPHKALVSSVRNKVLGKNLLSSSVRAQSLSKRVEKAISSFEGLILNRDDQSPFTIDSPTIRLLFDTKLAKVLELRLIRSAALGIEVDPPAHQEIPLLRLLHLMMQVEALQQKRGKAS